MIQPPIKPWPFHPGETVKLYWISSPYRHQTETNWLFNATFQRRDNKIVTVNYSLGLLPCFKLGRYYCDGVVDESRQYNHEYFRLNITNSVQGEFCTSHNIPPRIYPLYGRTDLLQEKLWRFHLRGRTYLVPCFEILRSYLANSVTLANCITSLDGLHPLFSAIDFKGRALEVELSKEVKQTDKYTIAYLLWLRFNTVAKGVWDSVLNKILSVPIDKSPNAYLDQLSCVHPLELAPPIDVAHTWFYRGMNYSNYTLVLEIYRVSGIRLDYDLIRYFHPSFTRKEEVDLSKRQKTEEKDSGDQELYIEGVPRSGSNSSRHHSVPFQAVEFEFFNPPKMERNVSKTTRHHILDVDQENLDFTRLLEEKAENADKVVTKVPLSPLKSYSGGEIKPLELKRLEVTKVTKGLETFLAAVELLEKDGLRMDLKIIYLPEGKSFSTYPDTQRRTCAVVFTSDVHRNPCLIFEPARTRDWRVSTLFMWPKSLDYEEIISVLLDNLVKHVGHWGLVELNALKDEECNTTKHNVLKGAEYKTLKHVIGQGAKRWAERIRERLGRG